jgi:hypothetical protein
MYSCLIIYFRFMKADLPLLRPGYVCFPCQCHNKELRKLYRGNEYTCKNRRIVGRVVFNVARVVSGKVGEWFFPELLVLLMYRVVWYNEFALVSY